MFVDIYETCYVYITVSLKNNAIASNSTLKYAFQTDSGSESQHPFQPLAGNITYCTFKCTYLIIYKAKITTLMMQCLII